MCVIFSQPLVFRGWLNMAKKWDKKPVDTELRSLDHGLVVRFKSKLRKRAFSLRFMCILSENHVTLNYADWCPGAIAST